MGNLVLKTNPKFNAVLANFPDAVRNKMQLLRELVIETADETDGIDELEETLKWGESSFVSKYGSTLRMDWKAKATKQYAMYFQCSSRLVETFRIVFGPKFQYEGNRALVFQLDQNLPIEELKKCIKATLTYNKVNT
jgi:hypothetical protein